MSLPKPLDCPLEVSAQIGSIRGMDVKSLRTGLGLTQGEFAALIGSSACYVAHLEKGRRNPSLKLALRIERATNAKGLVTAVQADKLAAAQAA